MGYREDAREAAGLLAAGERGDWRVAQLTYENTLRGRGANGGHPLQGKVSMEVWCAEVQANSSVRLRFGEATGSRYARIWAKYGRSSQATSDLPGFKDAYAEVDGTPDRARMMEYEATRLIEQGTPQQKAAAAAALMADPEVAEEATPVDSPVSQAMDTLADRMTQRRLEEAAGEPTESVGVYHERVKQAKADSPSYQYTRVLAAHTALVARFSLEEVAADLVASRATERPEVYVEGAERAAAWFTRLAQALRQERRPRLVGRAHESAG